MASPIEQFQIKPIIPVINFTNSSLFMVGATAVIVGGLLLATRKRAMVPDRAQSVAEMLHDFIASTLVDATGKEGMKFFPLVFSLFMFVLTANLLGMIPGFFTVTSHVIVTFALALLVIGTVVIYGFVKHGTHFLGLFVPSGVPVWLLPFIVVIELISFLSRPISLSLRLFANMLGGHIALKVFGSFVVSGLNAEGVMGPVIALLSFVFIAGVSALELLVCAIQAYVFALLTSLYINDAENLH
jgi:F-type H+-transporting ATPase subunit a